MEDEGNWLSIEQMDQFKELEKLSDDVWTEVDSWPIFARNTVGKQLVAAIDSAGANCVEGDGRFHHRDTLNFYYFARGSTKEAAYWVRRAKARKITSEETANKFLGRIEHSRRWINTLISQRRSYASHVHEEPAAYIVKSHHLSS